MSTNAPARSAEEADALLFEWQRALLAPLPRALGNRCTALDNFLGISRGDASFEEVRDDVGLTQRDVREEGASEA